VEVKKELHTPATLLLGKEPVLPIALEAGFSRKASLVVLEIRRSLACTVNQITAWPSYICHYMDCPDLPVAYIPFRIL
jgi:hypothetical protein